MAEVDISVVTYRPDPALFTRMVESLAEPAPGLRRTLLVQDNGPDPGVAASLEGLVAPWREAFTRVDIVRSGANVGFGRGHNAAIARGQAPWILVLNQDCILEPGALRALVECAERDPQDIAIWELRQVPYEHPKAYDPVTMDTPWASGAAMLVRRSAFDAVRGFEPRIFMYGEDVDLSWRLRAKGWRVVYRPRFGVVHRTYSEPGEVKPLQVLGGVATNLKLRARYGGFLAVLRGLAMLWGELLAPRSFRGRRRGLARAGLAFLWRWPYFAWTRVPPTATFRPVFSGWGYELRRDGAFVTFASHREEPGRERPLVSILIRTVDRCAWLREALESCAQQTYPNLEVVVIEDGPERSRAIVEAFADRLSIRYRATNERVGRSRAGNLAIAE